MRIITKSYQKNEPQKGPTTLTENQFQIEPAGGFDSRLVLLPGPGVFSNNPKSIAKNYNNITFDSHRI